MAAFNKHHKTSRCSETFCQLCNKAFQSSSFPSSAFCKFFETLSPSLAGDINYLNSDDPRLQPSTAINCALSVISVRDPITTMTTFSCFESKKLSERIVFLKRHYLIVWFDKFGCCDSNIACLTSCWPAETHFILHAHTYQFSVYQTRLALRMNEVNIMWKPKSVFQRISLNRKPCWTCLDSRDASEKNIFCHLSLLCLRSSALCLLQFTEEAHQTWLIVLLIHAKETSRHIRRA